MKILNRIIDRLRGRVVIVSRIYRREKVIYHCKPIDLLQSLRIFIKEEALQIDIRKSKGNRGYTFYWKGEHIFSMTIPEEKHE